VMAVLQNRSFLVACLALLVGLLPLIFIDEPAAGAGSLPNGFTQSRLAGGLTTPTAMAFAPDGRLFVAEQRGTVRVIESGELLVTPFLDFSGVIDSRGERGLLGIAFDPAFSTNGWVYIYYTHKATSTTQAHNRVVRVTAVRDPVTGVPGDTVVPGSEKLLLRLNNLSSALNHNGGALHFGIGGSLFIAVGENAAPSNAQSTDNLLGKMLRINKAGTIPTTNPFYSNPNVVGQDKAIWALGLRNPFSFAVQPGTGRIYINDVGARTWEEINNGVKGANYGWPIYEGPENDPEYRPSIFAYKHGNTATTGCAITGGTFYNPQTVQFPSGFVDDYLFADFCSGWIRRLDYSQGKVFPFKGMSSEKPVDLDVGSDGTLYFLARNTGSNTGSVERIRYTGN
jgi:glucose/arabinose dehydrogenase